MVTDLMTLSDFFSQPFPLAESRRAVTVQDLSGLQMLWYTQRTWFQQVSPNLGNGACKRAGSTLVARWRSGCDLACSLMAYLLGLFVRRRLFSS